LIARYIQHEQAHLVPYRPATETERAIDQLLRRRAKLTALKGALAMTLRGLPALEAEATALTKQFDVLIARLDEMLQTAHRGGAGEAPNTATPAEHRLGRTAGERRAR
jgi:soluble cytochrome b562